ncbi:hypothetical protein ACP3V3_01710 [Vibrio sp. PNB22_3_1]
MKGIYTGIGPRAITREQSYQLLCVTFVLAMNRYLARTGGAHGSDHTVYMAAVFAQRWFVENGYKSELSDLVRLYLPWDGFNGFSVNSDFAFCLKNPRATSTAKSLHRAWGRLQSGGRKMMSRNVHQVLGDDLDDPSHFVLCHTSDGADGVTKMATSATGGTGMAINVAAQNQVPVRNLGNPEVRNRMSSWLEDQFQRLEGKFGVDFQAYLDEALESHLPDRASGLSGDVVDVFCSNDFDVLIHCANCQNVMGAGVAKRLVDVFPDLRQVDKSAGKGREKLGKFSVLSTEFGEIYNAYGQLNYGRDPSVLYIDYYQLQCALESIYEQTKGKRVVIPLIGSGLANGCWLTISHILSQFPKWDLTVVRLPVAK